MRIQHNIMAMNAYRNLGMNNRALSGNLEKLSSGYKINRAGDDAAGLAISEKMRAQITSLDAAQKNVNDGISLVKTAEGAMQEIQDMLNRMEYLATQSANGTYDNEVDRNNLQKEVESLRSEINRIADSSNFNGTKLLNGNLDAAATVDVSLAGKIGTTAINAESNIEKIIGDATLAEGDKVIIDGNEYTYAEDADGSDGKTFGDWDALVAAAAENGVTLSTKVEGGTTSEVNVSAASANDIYKAGTDAVKAKFTLTFAGTETVDANTAFTIGDLTVLDGVANTSITNAAGVTAALQTAIGAGTTIEYDGIDYDVTIDGTGKVLTFVAAEDPTADGKNQTAMNATLTAGVVGSSAAPTLALVNQGKAEVAATYDLSKFDATSDSITVDGKAYTGLADKDALIEALAADDIAVTGTDTAPVFTKTTGATKTTEATKSGAALTLQIGDTSDDYNQMTVGVGDMHTAAMGTDADKDGVIDTGASIADIDISTQEGAAKAVGVIKDAINYVSSVRGDLGAIQNRLEHTNNNLAVMEENIQDAESTIRDTDIADEMMAYTKNNILIQSAQAMLAQANQVPQGVLQLMQ